jgi:DNA-binding MarR family transcriptional regulator
MQSFEIPQAPKIREAKPIDRRMYSVVPIRAASDKRLRATAWRVLVSVCSYANRAGLCWPGYENLAATHGVTRQAVGRQIKKLIAYGYLQKVKNHSWGRTAQILRVIYDETLSDRQLLERIPFEEKPPGHQWKVLKDAEQEFNNPEQMGTHHKVAITAERDTGNYLSVDDFVSLWKSACNQANIARIITPEDRQAVVSMCSVGVSRASFERVLAEVFEAWRVHRREPPHRLAWFAQRLRQEATLAPSPIAPTDAGT